MTTECLAIQMLRAESYGASWPLRTVFLANLLRRMAITVDDAMIVDARDSLCSLGDRARINQQLMGTGIGAGAGVMDAQIGLPLDDRLPFTKERIIALLRPDPRMLVEVQKIEVNSDPPCEVFQVVIEDGRGGSWNEVCKTQDQLDAFLRGIRVTFAMSDLKRLLPDFIGHGRHGRHDAPPLQFTQQSCIQHLA